MKTIYPNNTEPTFTKWSNYIKKEVKAIRNAKNKRDGKIKVNYIKH